jgi:hypothetical protein
VEREGEEFGEMEDWDREGLDREIGDGETGEERERERRGWPPSERTRSHTLGIDWREGDR